ncbi:MAG: hypothetical protein D6691_07390 [Candidatus Hydrogenedentota bacterium]|nr:MAG: hypothetical protein D6691_07390 [Candidatus Hydrogenedentota bacterium]
MKPLNRFARTRQGAPLWFFAAGWALFQQAKRVGARLGFVVLALMPFGVGHVSGAPSSEYRMLWVDVFHPGLRTPQEIETMLAQARRANYNALIVQVRKACDAFYNSRVEPKNEAIAPDFDPLAYILERAHNPRPGEQRLEVHAWLVTYRCRMPFDNTWKNPRHVFQRHPEWLSQTIRGEKEDKGENPGRYYLDPGVPAVLDYTLEVVRDLVTRYDVDGIHFDYIRYPEAEGAGNVWGYHPIAVERFNRLYGRSGKPAPNDPQWCEFRRRQIFHLVRKVYAHVREWRPDVKVSAATITWGTVSGGFERTDAYGKIFQDWPEMLRAGILDIAVPMNYKRESVASQARAHREWAAFLGQVAAQSGRFGVNGVDGETLNTLPDVLAQIRATRSMRGIAGIATYCYAETRKGSPPPPDVEFFQTLRSQVFTQPARVPVAPWLARPTEGLVRGVVRRNGKPVDGAQVTLDGESTWTDGTGFYAFARVAPGSHTLSVSGSGAQPTARTVRVEAGKVTVADLELASR